MNQSYDSELKGVTLQDECRGGLSQAMRNNAQNIVNSSLRNYNRTTFLNDAMDFANWANKRD